MKDAPGTIWASVGYRSENDIRGEFACHPDIYKGSEHYTRTATIPDPMSDPRVVALVEALHEYKKRARRIPFNVAIKADAALSAITKDQQE